MTVLEEHRPIVGTEQNLSRRPRGLARSRGRCNASKGAWQIGCPCSHLPAMANALRSPRSGNLMQHAPQQYHPISPGGHWVFYPRAPVDLGQSKIAATSLFARILLPTGTIRFSPMSVSGALWGFCARFDDWSSDTLAAVQSIGLPRPSNASSRRRREGRAALRQWFPSVFTPRRDLA